MGVAAASIALGACGARGSRMRAPPRVEFLIHADSTYWVSTHDGRLFVRGAPITLTRFDGHYYEVYTADADFSYDDAELIGQRVYRRDLTAGDSLAVLADTVVPRVALAYARAHPDERPLGRDEEGQPNPSTSATADIDIVGVYGPYVSYEYHVDVKLPAREAWHTTRRGVIDLRTGHDVALTDVLGATEAGRVIGSARRSYDAVRDSIVSRRPELNGDELRAADALARLEFDERSFIIENVDRKPAITFGVPGRGAGAVGNIVELEPVSVDSLSGWTALRDQLATSDTASADDVDTWSGPGYSVIARYDTSGETARVSIRDQRLREWNVATVTGWVHRIEWLDRPLVSDADRRALNRAFNDAATYDGRSRVASIPPSRLNASVTPVSYRRSPIALPRQACASKQNCSRKSSRVVGAHDAPARQQHGPRFWRRHSLDDGQVRSDRGLSP